MSDANFTYIKRRDKGSYLDPEKHLVERKDDAERKAAQARIQERMSKSMSDEKLKEQNEERLKKFMGRHAVDMRDMTLLQKIGVMLKMNPLFGIAGAAAAVTIVRGVRASAKGDFDRSYRLMNVRLGIGIFMVSYVFFIQFYQKKCYQLHLRQLKQDILAELGEDGLENMDNNSSP